MPWNLTKLGGCFVLVMAFIVSYNSFCNAEFTNYTVLSSCDHVTRRVLAAESKSQTKTIIRRSNMADQEIPSFENGHPGEISCDVWTVKASNEEKGHKSLTLTLISMDIQESSQIFLISESPDQQILFRSVQDSASSLPVSVASPSGVSLVWAYTAHQSDKSGQEEHLSFSYSLGGAVSGSVGYNVSHSKTTVATTSDHSPDTPEKKEKAVLASAIVVSLVTATATIVSIVRAGVCSRLRYLCQYRRVSKSDRVFSERVTRQERFELNTLSPTSGLSRDANSSHDRENRTNGERSNNLDNNVASSNNYHGGSLNGDTGRSSCTNAIENINNVATGTGGRSRDTNVLLELEVREGELRQTSSALTGNGRDGEADMCRESAISVQGEIPSNHPLLRSGLSSGDVGRTRRVRFRRDEDKDIIATGQTETGQLILSNTTGHTVPETTPQSQGVQPQSTISVSASTLNYPTASSEAVTTASAPVISSSESQSLLHSSLAMPLSQSLYSSSIESPIQTVNFSGGRFIPASHEYDCISNGEHAGSIVVTPRSIAMACPNCSYTGHSSETHRGRQPMAPIILPGDISRFMSLDETAPRYSYGETPPPAYSALFPE